MSYFVTTPLGREVPLGDWQALHGDTILKVLHDFRMSPFNPENRPHALTALCNATGLSPADVQALCEALAADGLVEVVSPNEYRITGKGVAFVRSSPGRAAASGSLP